MEPVHPRTPLAMLVDAIIVIAAVALGIWFALDDTIPEWLIRLSWAGAIVAGFGLALICLKRLTNGRL